MHACNAPRYAGGTSSVLFTLRPQLHVYRPTRISQNYVLYNPPQTGRLASESYFARGSEVPEMNRGGSSHRAICAFLPALHLCIPPSYWRRVRFFTARVVVV